MSKHGLVHILKLSVIMLLVSVIFCGAVEHDPKQSATGSGKKKLRLFAKNPTTWSIVKGGANGALVYREATGAFTLNASPDCIPARSTPWSDTQTPRPMRKYWPGG